ncbi:zinc-binding dehydrogenase [Ligilactobacillus pobuzihii]|uniref:NADP-dependent oxidoreductase n=1 Tax=Ligilactobacillus pobuzihii TaxID=449659 RepID=UPI0019D07315|nr:NADP-dependent oxidoreductase [Ligilactobacillus pobuzihii]MBN7274683.1 zinc-binding dehydrogenase [Ligilactobacillus pobuzihii]
MKAIVIDRYGGPEELHEKDIPVPQIAADEVLIETKATSINPIDWKTRRGYLKEGFPWAFPVVLGWDIAGIVTEVGADVREFKVGDEVFARPDMYNDGKRGTYAEYAAVKADKLVLKPQRLSFEQAAAIPLAGLTAWQVIVDRLKVKAGDKILVQAGAGGVGMFAIQIAKHFGAYVATTASAVNEKLLRQLGADEVIDYHQTQITDVLHDYDAVFDTIDQIPAGLEILKSDGQLVTVAGNPTEEQQNSHPAATSWWLKTNGAELKELANLVENNELRVVIDSIYPMTTSGLRSAHEKSETGHSHGKIVITTNER